MILVRHWSRGSNSTGREPWLRRMGFNRVRAMAALKPVKDEPDDRLDFIDLCLGLLILFLIFVVLFYFCEGCKLLFLAFFS